jgi:hypothetical protein
MIYKILFFAHFHGYFIENTFEFSDTNASKQAIR